ncbi:T9SS type A sorting domain-containing protein [bacterium]|nr:T9SS type A sorting domain-containing protein [bacterium]
MRKVMLIVVITMLGSLSGLFSQVVWDQSACLYRRSMSSIIFKENIPEGTIIFYSLNNQLFLETYSPTGDQLLDQAIDLNFQIDEESLLEVKKSADGNFLLYWKDDIRLFVKKISSSGSDLWDLPLEIYTLEYGDGIVKEVQLLEDQDDMYVLVNYGSVYYYDCLTNYKINLVNNIPYIISQNIIYEGENLMSYTGAITSDGLTYMWLQPDESKLFLRIGDTNHEIDNYNSYVSGVFDDNLYKTCKILELSNDKVLFGLITEASANLFSSMGQYPDVFIYDRQLNDFTNITLEFPLIDVQKISENEFLAVSISEVLRLSEYNIEGNLINSTYHYDIFGSLFDGFNFILDQITSVDSEIVGENYRIVLVSKTDYLQANYGVKVGFYSYNLNDSSLIFAEDYISGDCGEDSALFANLGAISASFIINHRLGHYSAYKQHFIAYESASDAISNPQEIAVSFPYEIDKVNSFIWNDNNNAIMFSRNCFLESGVDESGMPAGVENILTDCGNSSLHRISENSYLVYYNIYHYGTGVSVSQRAKLFKEDGSIETMILHSGFGGDYSYDYLTDIEEGNGWFVYKTSDWWGADYDFNKIENGNMLAISYIPIENLDLLAVENNYLISRYNGDFKITKIDDEGELANGWTAEGQSFTDDYNYISRNRNISSYQNRLLFSYSTNDTYKVFDINLDDLSQTVNYTFPCTNNNIIESYVIDNRFYKFHNNNDELVISCYNLDNNFEEVWQETLAEYVSDFSLKALEDRFVLAYTQEIPGSQRVYLRTIDFQGQLDQFQDGFVLPLNLTYQYKPAISVLDNNSLYVSRIENDLYDNPGVFCDLIDLSYFVPNDSEDVTPLTFSASNYPNPFNPKTTISYNLPKAGVTKVEVFNLRGQLVKTLINEEQSAGNQKVVWSGKDKQGKQVSSGIYLYKIKNTGDVISGKMVLMK